jgi:hypothetical protein
VTPPEKCSVLDLSFHLQSLANSAINKGMTINFNNLIVGTHESKVLFLWSPKEEVAMLGAFLGIKDGIEAILARDGIIPAQRVILEEFRAIAGKNNWDLATLRKSVS